MACTHREELVLIPPRKQWCIQIETTSVCNRRCSNCTRPAVAHLDEPFYMSVEDFAKAVEAVKEFPLTSPPDRLKRPKVIGMIGGEPLMHPDFARLCEVMENLPANQRGLWTGLDWKKTKYADIVRRIFSMGYINNNQHVANCFHQPVLVASKDVVSSEEDRRRLIDACPMQREWASSITPRGYYFCEVAGALAQVFSDGPDGIRVAPGCWSHDLDEYRSQIDYYCQRCGVCLPLPGRKDSEGRDDISQTNLNALRNSPRVLAGDYCKVDEVTLAGEGWNPCCYLRAKG